MTTAVTEPQASTDEQPSTPAPKPPKPYEPAEVPGTAGRQLPWAGLVTGSAEEGETLTSGQLLQRAGLDWNVGIRPLYRKMADGSFKAHPAARETYRDDPSELALGVVKTHYEPYSNIDVFAFGDSIVETGQGRWVDAGQQGNGYRVFMTMLLDEFSVLDGDLQRLYLFLRASHDGSTGLNAWLVPFAVRCTNQQAMVNAAHQGHWTVLHTKNIAERAEEAKHAIQASLGYEAEFRALAEKLAATTVSDQKVRAVLNRLIPESRGRRDEMIADLKHVYYTSPTVEPYRGNAYGLLNAVTEYYDHMKRQNSDNARFESIMLGEGAKARAKVLRDLAGLN